MGIMADNAREMVETMEAMVYDLRQTASEVATRLAGRVNRPLSDYAEALASADTPEELAKALEALRKEMQVALKRTYLTATNRWGKADTEMGDFNKAYSAMVHANLYVKRIADLLEAADMHDVLLQEYRNMERGFSEAGL